MTGFFAEVFQLRFFHSASHFVIPFLTYIESVNILICAFVQDGGDSSDLLEAEELASSILESKKDSAFITAVSSILLFVVYGSPPQASRYRSP